LIFTCAIENKIDHDQKNKNKNKIYN
jgi:hypothetical protein